MVAAAHSFAYIETDIPQDMTLDMWRRRNVVAAKPRHAGRRNRLRRRAVESAHPAPARLRVA
jgi:hypothetical protein